MINKYSHVLILFLISSFCLNGQDTACGLILKDETTDNYRIDVQKQLFFRYTNEKLRPFLKENSYLSCKGNLSYISGGYYFLNLEFAIASKNAAIEFGGITQGMPANILLMDGNSIQLRARETAESVYQEDTQTHIYKAQYALSSSVIKKLRKGEVDSIRIIWKQGFEDYEVHYLDFFRDQFHCLTELQN